MTLKPLKRLAEVSSLAAKGDLTLAVSVNGGNEIAQVSNAFNEMIASLRQLTGSIRITSDEVAGSAYNMQQSAEQTSRATEEVTEAIQEVASGSDTQLQSLQECQRAMTEMTIGIQRIAESTSSVSELAADTTALATEGETVIDQTLQQMNAIESNVVETVTTLHELKEQSDKIGGILALIGDVANQTNLLALNASIEAARAGEHGKGFAVVAHEIRKLAERSKESSEQIGSILHSIGSHAATAVSSMEQSVEAARFGSSISAQAGESFRSIVTSIRDVSSQVQEVSAASEQMSAGSEQIAASLDALEGITASSAGNSQRVAAASEEQLASMQEVASSSEQLRNLASTLNEAISRFKT
ncbi:methyl-accepting chemotaxis protein [Bacillus sp. FJAT-28004]|uniref:methyl-accepting chemotaxis protein n=1 Tax=Bacillus sp. FJAT-28004 TaxID=1679165 RepID=UPI0039C97D16